MEHHSKVCHGYWKTSFALVESYQPKTVSLAAKLKENFDVDATLIRGTVGIIDLTFVDKLIYSRNSTSRFLMRLIWGNSLLPQLALHIHQGSALV